MQNFKGLASFWSREGRFESYLVQTPQRQVVQIVLQFFCPQLRSLSVCLSFCSPRFYACHSLRSRSWTFFLLFCLKIWQKFGRTSVSLVTLTCGSWSEDHHDPYISRSSDFALDYLARRGSSIHASLSVWHTSGPKFDPHIRHILSWRLGHENISTAILPLQRSCQLLAKECALSTGKLPRRLAQEQCGYGNWPRPKWLKMPKPKP